MNKYKRVRHFYPKFIINTESDIKYCIYMNRLGLKVCIICALQSFALIHNTNYY